MSELPPSTEAIARPFGEANRLRLLKHWFETHGAPTPADAWKHVYRLLLWIDRTIGLAHCYESDKAQPGRPWYARSLAFHGWVSESLGVDPSELGEHIDWLFGEATNELVAALPQMRAARALAAEAQRDGLGAHDYPVPGDDPDLHAILSEVLEPVAGPLSMEVKRELTERLTLYISQENRRRNLIGEGFEDTIAAVLATVTGYPVRTRARLEALPGFHPAVTGQKTRKVDIAVLRPEPGGPPRRVLITAKWSVRADREEQFATDYGDYVRLEASGQLFEYVWITNEFDPARLRAAAERSVNNKRLFDAVVHIQPEAIRAVYQVKPSASQVAVLDLIDQGRIQSLESYLHSLL